MSKRIGSKKIGKDRNGKLFQNLIKTVANLFSQRTTIMSWRKLVNRYEVFNRLYKDLHMIKAYMVPPYSIRWEGPTKNILQNIFKEFPSYKQIISRLIAEYVYILNTR